MRIVITSNPELRTIVDKIKSKIKQDYKIYDNLIITPDLFIDLDINYEVDIIKLVFSTRNQTCRTFFEKNMGNLIWRTEIINYSYLVKEFPTVGLEVYNRKLNEQDILDITNMIIESIYDYNKKR